MNIRETINRVESKQKEWKSIYHQVAAKFGISATTLWVLYYISEHDEDLTQQDLCRQGFYPKQTINTAVTGLANDGLIELIPIPGTRNRKKLHLTPKGYEFALRTAIPLKAAEENAYGRLSEDELQAYLSALCKLNAYLKEETEKL